jgi:hypothetical protein
MKYFVAQMNLLTILSKIRVPLINYPAVLIEN